MFPAPFDASCPAAAPDSPVSVEVVSAGLIHAKLEQVVNTGEKGPASMSLNIGIIHHPEGNLAIDSGLGLATRAGEYPKFPLSSKNIDIPEGAALVERNLSVSRILLTHAHYDHIGGIADLPGTEVWLTPEEWQYMHAGDMGVSKEILSAGKWMPVLPNTWALGRLATDVMGDGTVLYLKTPGHTPGAASVLVRAKEANYLFIGDTAWVTDHLHEARRPWYVTLLLDSFPKQLVQSLMWARELMNDCPDLRVITGHDPVHVGGSLRG